MQASPGRLDCSAAKATFTANFADAASIGPSLKNRFRRSTKLAVFFVLHRRRSLAAVLQGRQLNHANHVLQAKLLDLIDRVLKPGLRRRIAQSAKQHDCGNLRANGSLGLLRARFGCQDLLAGFRCAAARFLRSSVTAGRRLDDG